MITSLCVTSMTVPVPPASTTGTPSPVSMPRRARRLLMITASSYAPLHTSIVSPSPAASIAACMLVKFAPPLSSTVHVAPAAVPAHASTSTASTLMYVSLFDLMFTTISISQLYIPDRRLHDHESISRRELPITVDIATHNSPSEPIHP